MPASISKLVFGERCSAPCDRTAVECDMPDNLVCDDSRAFIVVTGQSAAYDENHDWERHTAIPRKAGVGARLGSFAASNMRH
jgi:hypothetical protein